MKEIWVDLEEFIEDIPRLFEDEYSEGYGIAVYDAKRLNGIHKISTIEEFDSLVKEVSRLTKGKYWILENLSIVYQR